MVIGLVGYKCCFYIPALFASDDRSGVRREPEPVLQLTKPGTQVRGGNDTHAQRAKNKCVEAQKNRQEPEEKREAAVNKEWRSRRGCTLKLAAPFSTQNTVDTDWDQLTAVETSHKQNRPYHGLMTGLSNTGFSLTVNK